MIFTDPIMLRAAMPRNCGIFAGANDSGRQVRKSAAAKMTGTTGAKMKNFSHLYACRCETEAGA